MNKILKSYFGQYFVGTQTQILAGENLKKLRKISRFLRKIFISDAEIKHTNSKSVITVFIYNREKFLLIKKILKIKKLIFIIINMVISYIFRLKYLKATFNRIIKKKKQKNKRKMRKILVLKFIKRFGLYKYFILRLKKILHENLMIIRRYKLRLNINKYKFNIKKTIFLRIIILEKSLYINFRKIKVIYN